MHLIDFQNSINYDLKHEDLKLFAKNKYETTVQDGFTHITKKNLIVFK